MKYYFYLFFSVWGSFFQNKKTCFYKQASEGINIFKKSCQKKISGYKSYSEQQENVSDYKIDNKNPESDICENKGVQF